MSHIVDSCPRTKLNSSLQRLHTAYVAAVNRLTSLWHLGDAHNKVAQHNVIKMKNEVYEFKLKLKLIGPFYVILFSHFM